MSTEYANQFREKVKSHIHGAMSIEPTSSVATKQDINTILITHDNCNPCDLVRTYLSEELENGMIRECNLKDDECKELAKQLKITETPAIVIDDNGHFKECELRTENDDFIYECPYSETKEEQAPTKPPRHGKLGISCMSRELKNTMGWQLQSADATPEQLALMAGIPECSDEDSGMPIAIGFSEIKKGSGTQQKAASSRGKYMSKCLSGKTGEAQPLRMKRCSQEWREMPDKEKKDYA